MVKRFQPRLELLEDRLVPTGFVWQDAERLTLSLASDSVAILDNTSQLFQTLSHLPAETWQTEILRAFQTWAETTNINFTLVADSGLPFGTSGLPQGDTRFGDIRIGALSQSSDALAVASPADLFAGTWAGDIFLNSEVLFSLDGENGPSLFSVMLHEIGHSLGLDHNDDPLSVMQEHLVLMSALPAVDIERIQALYGVRLHDEFEGSAGNEDFSTATMLAAAADKSNNTLALTADITTSTDVDVYSFRTQGNTQQFVVSLDTANVSLLLPRLIIYNAAGEELSSVTRINHFTGDLELQFQADGAALYYVKVAANDAFFDIGSYQLQVEFVSNQADPPAKEPKDKESRSLADRAIFLNPYRGNPDETSYKAIGVLAAGDDVVYRFKAPNADRLGDADTMLMTVRRTTAAPWQPNLQIFDRFGNPVAFETLLDGNGMITLQLRDVDANQDYFVQISTDDPDPGEFFLGIDFTADPIELEVFASGSSGTAATAHLLVLDRNRLVHFLLFAQDVAGREGDVRLIIENENGDTVGEMLSPIGDYLSASIFLPQGRYTLHLMTLDENGAALAGVDYIVSGKRLSDPVGPELQDLLIDPVFPRPPVSPVVVSSVTPVMETAAVAPATARLAVAPLVLGAGVAAVTLVNASTRAETQPSFSAAFLILATQTIGAAAAAQLHITVDVSSLVPEGTTTPHKLPYETVQESPQAVTETISVPAENVSRTPPANQGPSENIQQTAGTADAPATRSSYSLVVFAVSSLAFVGQFLYSFSSSLHARMIRP